MGNKALILFMYLIAVFLVLRRWYDNGGTGMPYPSAITAPSYLYGVLALTADFTGGLTTVLSVGLTYGLYQSLKKNGSNSVALPGGLTFPVGNPVGPKGPVGAPPKSSGKTPVGPKGPVG